MSRVYKPVRVEVTGRHGYGYGFTVCYPQKTRTRGTGLTGLMAHLLRLDHGMFAAIS